MSRPEPEEVRSEKGETEGEGAGRDSTGSILRGIVTESSALVAKEVELLRAEMREKIALLQSYATGMAIGSALLVCAFFFLLSAMDKVVVVALQTMMGPRVGAWLGPLLLAVLLGATGLWLLASARRKLKAEGLTPKHTIETLRENTTWIKEKLK